MSLWNHYWEPEYEEPVPYEECTDFDLYLEEKPEEDDE